ncbi:hypothetical protein FRB94_005775 [Tulasnella sp. JGI-2019a]|nr:hypothetical protein FRB93_004947 [Tulasnella sp. JGI-2019a]KAG8999885.1 hypothetical protein FRB94_005775 [Tulasnella sp. JGI-2019a]KAG9031678.1 hypothetical protein FRB95_002417 [Tulasnella sp. JGI-2019a]
MPSSASTNTASLRARSVQPSSGSPPPPQSPLRAQTRVPTTPTTASKPSPLDSKPLSPTLSKKEEPSIAASQDKGSQKLGATGLASASALAASSVSAKAASAEAEAKAKKNAKPPIDMETFEQILELDEDDEDKSFSKGIVDNYYEQVETTFTEMEEALKHKDLAKLSSLGHFLKGSSAALGVTQVQATCEKMQHNGHLKGDDGSGELSKDEAVKRIEVLVRDVRGEYKEAKEWFDKFFAVGA